MKTITTILIIIGIVTGFAQSSYDTTYSVEVSTTISSAINYFKNERYPGGPSSNSFGYGFFARVMWHPGRMLAVGIMSGYTFIVEDEFTLDSLYSNQSSDEASANLAGIPLQVAISMQSNGLEVGVGMGPYLMLSTINYSTTAKAERMELGITFFALYRFRIGQSISVGPEFRALYLSYRGILSVMPSITLQFDIWRY